MVGPGVGVADGGGAGDGHADSGVVVAGIGGGSGGKGKAWRTGERLWGRHVLKAWADGEGGPIGKLITAADTDLARLMSQG